MLFDIAGSAAGDLGALAGRTVLRTIAAAAAVAATAPTT